MDLLKKFNWRWLMMLAAVMMMGVSMTACGDDDDDDDSNAGAYVGVWADAYDLEQGYNEVFAIQLSSDGTGRDGEWNVEEGEFYGEDMQWEWSARDGMMTVTYGEKSETRPFTISDDGRIGTIDGEIYIKVQ